MVFRTGVDCMCRSVKFHGSYDLLSVSSNSVNMFCYLIEIWSI